jgi:hypothetical protein
MEVIVIAVAILAFGYCMMAYKTRSRNAKLEGVPAVRKSKFVPSVRNNEGYFVDSSGNIRL